MIYSEIWVKIGVIAAIIIFFIVITIINMKTKKPDDCVSDDSECKTCVISCIHNLNKEFKDAKDNRE